MLSLPSLLPSPSSPSSPSSSDTHDGDAVVLDNVGVGSFLDMYMDVLRSFEVVRQQLQQLQQI